MAGPGGLYEIDTEIQLGGTFINALTGIADDPTEVTLYILKPNGTKITLTYPVPGDDIVRVDAGIYTYNFEVDASGNWIYKWQGSGHITATTADITITVQPSAVIAG